MNVNTQLTLAEYITAQGPNCWWIPEPDPATLIYYFDNTLERKGIKAGIKSGMMLKVKPKYSDQIFYVLDERIYCEYYGLKTYEAENCFNTLAEATHAAREKIKGIIKHKQELVERYNKQIKSRKEEIKRLTKELKVK